ncbi:hypothetical protein Bbelb_248770 [Branchiostoma belcheri]|nr:hypothetical protein Bbelb_248770 [Branchiostoma belcheri]
MSGAYSCMTDHLGRMTCNPSCTTQCAPIASPLSDSYSCMTDHLGSMTCNPSCTTQCAPISPPMAGSYSCMTDHLGRMTCTPSCMDGFEFESPPAAEYVCENGAWSPPGPYPNCVFAGQKCEKIPPPIWGSYYCQTDHTGTERCYPSCMQGYEFESPPAAEYVCINGQFSPPGPYPNCRKSEEVSVPLVSDPEVSDPEVPVSVQACPKLHAPAHGSLSCRTDQLGIQTCFPACDAGYSFQTAPAAEYICLNGQWAPPGPVPNCVPDPEVADPELNVTFQACPKLHAPAHGSLSCRTDQLGIQTCFPACDAGYSFQTAPAAEYICLNGQWAPPGPVPNCVPAPQDTDPEVAGAELNVSAQECAKLHAPAHGSLSCRTDQLGIQTCFPACDAGYSFQTAPAAEYICLNGQWAPPGPVPNCVPGYSFQTAPAAEYICLNGQWAPPGPVPNCVPDTTSTTTTVKPTSAPVQPANVMEHVNIGNECIGDVTCGERVTCSAWGDPHYRTFDGKRFNFQGNCKYVLSRGMDFKISAPNVHRRGNTRVSFVDAVEFELYGNLIAITQGKEVFVNGVKWTLPACIGGLASITQQGNNIVIDTALCITVTFDGNHRVTVELPPYLASTVDGLCGNANGNQGDDLVKPDMTPAGDAVEFGNSWVAFDDVSCPSVTAAQQFDITQADQALVQELESQQFCGHLQDTNSPFSACFPAVEPTDYIDTCVYDMAASGGTSDHSFMCENFEEYIQACAAAGVYIEGWREQTGCALQCPPNSHYSYSTSACQDSCRTPTASSTCGRPNVEGCECDPGYIWSGMTCVEPKDCGCLHQMNYHALGEVWGTSDGQQCECLPNFQVSCAPMSCLPGAEWSLQDGVYGCHQTLCEMHADIVFVVDGSASIPAYEFEKVKTFLNNVVGHFDIGPGATQVGVVQYSSSPQQEFALNAHSSLAGLQQAISNINIVSRGTATGSALTFARDQALTAANGARPGVPKIVVVVTDGMSGDDVVIPSQNLHNDGVATFAIGVTEMINYDELSAIAGSPDHVSTVFDFDALDDIKERLSSQLCEVEATTQKPTTTTTQTPKPTTTTTPTPKPTTTTIPATTTQNNAAVMGNDIVNIGNECLGDVFCGDRVTCSARGDPHYRTFDGKRFNFQGNCKYVLSRGQDFTVSARNANRRGNMRVSFVDAVEFTLYGQTITITQGKEVFINGVKWTLPACIGGFASITQQGNNIVIDTILCITVTFDGNHHVLRHTWRSWAIVFRSSRVRLGWCMVVLASSSTHASHVLLALTLHYTLSVTVELPSHLAGLVGGLCGNANGIQGDDLVKPDLTPAQNGVEFGNSWVAPDDTSCPAVLADQQFDIAQADQALVQELESQQFCGHLQDTNSPFSACFPAVEPSDYIDDCVYDMAASGSTSDHSFMCENFEGYVQACAAAGIYLEGWREQTGCALQCPPHSHYSYSTSACQDSCRTPTASSTCGRPNVEGCECDPGYIWSGMTCVEPRDCGCLHEETYHALGEHWGTSDGQQCECLPNFQVSCAPMSCLPGAEWSLQDGVYGCHQVPTLKPTTTTTQTPKPTTTPVPAASTAACAMQADIVFVVDGSASVPAYEFEKIKTFLNNVVGHFDIGSGATQVGVVQYSSSPQQEFALNAHSSLAGLQQAISNIVVISRGTSTGSALTFARDQALTAANGARPGVPKIVVVVTDGMSGDDVIIPSQNLHSDGVTTFAIGVTEMINYDELSAIAGSPDHVSTVFDFDALDDIMEPLSAQLCEAPTLPTPTPATTTAKPATQAPVAPLVNDIVNIGNECLGDVFCGDRVTCSARGDPHYRTFDGKRFNFQGNCKYVLSRGQDFTVSARNANRRGNMRVSFVDSVEFTLYGQTITITQGKEVFINGVKWTLPACIGGFASITQQGNNIVIDTILCITVTFDGNHHSRQD